MSLSSVLVQEDQVNPAACKECPDADRHRCNKFLVPRVDNFQETNMISSNLNDLLRLLQTSYESRRPACPASRRHSKLADGQRPASDEIA